MPDTSQTYCPIYRAERNLYTHAIVIYGAIGKRIYYKCSGREAARLYEAEWEDLEALYAEA